MSILSPTSFKNGDDETMGLSPRSQRNYRRFFSHQQVANTCLDYWESCSTQRNTGFLLGNPLRVEDYEKVKLSCTLLEHKELNNLFRAFDTRRAYDNVILLFHYTSTQRN